eukprot:3938438-Rhodomonas_salina.1
MRMRPVRQRESPGAGAQASATVPSCSRTTNPVPQCDDWLSTTARSVPRYAGTMQQLLTHQACV